MNGPLNPNWAQQPTYGQPTEPQQEPESDRAMRLLVLISRCRSILVELAPQVMADAGVLEVLKKSEHPTPSGVFALLAEALEQAGQLAQMLELLHARAGRL